MQPTGRDVGLQRWAKRNRLRPLGMDVPELFRKYDGAHDGAIPEEVYADLPDRVKTREVLVVMRKQQASAAAAAKLNPAPAPPAKKGCIEGYLLKNNASRSTGKPSKNGWTRSVLFRSTPHTPSYHTQ
jgi:hypothetical protein